MKRREPLLRKVCSMRKRLRDRAAAQVQRAEAERQQAAADERRVANALTAALDEGGARLSGVGPDQLLHFDDERRWMLAENQLARGRVQKASTQADQLRAALRDRERALRTSEKLLERYRSDRAQAETSREQKANDDRSASGATRRRT